MGKQSSSENNKPILIGVIAIIFVVGIYFAIQPDELQTNSLVVDVEVPDNVDVVGSTLIVCPEGYTVKTHIGGTEGQDAMPFCQAPNPSIETFGCGDSLIVDGVQHTIQCTTVP